MKFIAPLALTLLLGVLAFTPVAHAASASGVTALLINASKGGGGSDPKLAPYENDLKRNLPFDTFKFAGEGAANVGSGKGSIALGGGHQLEFSDADTSGPVLRVRVRWVQGGREVMATTLSLPPGKPAVLGRGGDGQVPVVLIVVK